MWRCFGIQNTENGAVLGATAALLSSLPPPPQPLFLASPLQPTKNLKRYRSGTQIFGISLSRIDLETEHRENTASVAMEGSESKAVFESLNLNPQCFTDEFYNCVADLVDSAFGFFHQKAANIVKADEGTERSAELKKEARTYRPSWWVLLGDMGTGKTSLVTRFVKGQFFDYQESTIGAAFFTQVLSLNEGTIKFDIWDTAGQERYHSLAPMYYRGAAAAVVVYDITSMESFEKAKKWVQELQRQGNPNMFSVLVGNKADLDTKRKVNPEVGEQYAKENGLHFFETSAKSAQNVNDLFFEIAKRLAKNTPSRPTGIKLQRRSQEGRARSFCCSR